MVLPPLMHGLKAQKHLAQGKRSDTLGQSMLVSDALKGQKPYFYPI